MHPIHKLPKLEKFLLLTTIFSGLIAFLVITIQAVTSPLNKFTQATIPGVIVRSWNFDTGKENWKTVNVRSSFVRNGHLNIVIGNQGNNAMTFNRLALSKLTSPLKYLTFRVAFKKNPNSLVLPTQAADILTNVDLQVVNLPVTTPQLNPPTGGTACTQDVRMCPDGTYVRRVPPGCSFAPCPTTAFPTFLFNVYYKKLETSAWKGPIPVSGKISPDFQEFYAKFPESGQITVEALKIEFKRGLVLNDLIQFDQIAIMQENAPTVSIYPTANTSPRPTLFRNSPTPFVCITPPPCYYGTQNSDGTVAYCLPPYPNAWCPIRTTTTPLPTKPYPTANPSCVPYPDNCITWVNGRATMTCQFLVAQNWCPLPTCTPRPACLDATPACLIPETPDMCPSTSTIRQTDPYYPTQ